MNKYRKCVTMDTVDYFSDVKKLNHKRYKMTIYKGVSMIDFSYRDE